MKLRTAQEARDELQSKGISITAWAVANQFSPNLVFEVLGGRKKCLRGQSRSIAIKLGLIEGEIVTDIANALERRTTPDRRQNHERREATDRRAADRATQAA